MTEYEATEHEARFVITKDELAHIGEGVVAYLREFDSDDLKEKFPGMPEVESGTKLWAVFAADGGGDVGWGKAAGKNNRRTYYRRGRAAKHRPIERGAGAAVLPGYTGVEQDHARQNSQVGARR